jgi:hypothetical protein
LIKLIMNLVRRHSGSIRVLGQDNLAREAEVKARIGFVPDEPSYHADVSLRDLARATSLLYRQWDDSVFRRLVSQFQLPMEKKFKALSHGTKVKFALALALSLRGSFGPPLRIPRPIGVTLQISRWGYAYVSPIKEFSRGCTRMLTNQYIARTFISFYPCFPRKSAAKFSFWENQVHTPISKLRRCMLIRAGSGTLQRICNFRGIRGRYLRLAGAGNNNDPTRAMVSK